jgi:hypothetical protein
MHLSKAEKCEMNKLLSDDFVGECIDAWRLIGKERGLKGNKLAKFSANVKA